MEKAEQIVIYDLGLVKPWQRFAFGFCVTSAVIFAVQPPSMFIDGYPKAFSLNGEPDTTPVPWWIAPTLVASIFGLYI